MRVLLAVVLACAARVAAAQVPEDARQMILVHAAGWNAREGSLHRYQRDGGGDWRPVGKGTRVSLGKSGLAWGRGVAPVDPARPPVPGPAKREGDGRTPAGVFRLGEATGETAQPPAGTRLPYRPSTDLVCVDDPGSPQYNRIVPDGGEWRSSERMDLPVIYRRVIVVQHNTAQAAGGGSCIFLHIWRAPGAVTLGCTAMDGAVLESLLAWLDPASAPVFVVLPDAAYRKLRAAWRLP